MSWSVSSSNLLAWFIPKDAACEAATPRVPRPPKFGSSGFFDAPPFFDELVDVVEFREFDVAAVVVVDVVAILPNAPAGNPKGFMPPAAPNP